MSIRISADGFSLSVYNVLDGSLLQTEYTPSIPGTPMHIQLHDELLRPRIMDYNFQSVELLADTPSSCVPLEHFRREEMSALYKLTFPSEQVSSDEIQYQILPTLEVVELFSINKDVMSIVKDIFPDIQVGCYEGKLLEDAALVSRQTPASTKCLHAIVDDHSLLLCSFSNKKLQFAATYRVDNNSDRIFYIMAVWKALGMDTMQDTLCIKGNKPELTAGISRFIQKVDECE